MKDAVSNHMAEMLRSALFYMVILLSTCVSTLCHADIAVIGNESLPKMDKTMVGRIYTGRTVRVEGIAVQPVNLKATDTKRASFLREILQQSDDDYVSYWIVRRAIGKGTSPLEVDNAQEVINFVLSNKGAIGYVNETDLVPGLNVLLLLP